MSLTSLIATSSSIPSEIHKDLSLYGIIDIQNEVIGSVPLTVRGADGQTANLIEAKNYAGTTVFSVDNSGNVTYLGDEYVTDHLTVNGIADLLGTTNCVGLLTANGGITIAAGGLSVIGDSTFDNQVSIHNLVVSGDAEFRDNLILTNGKQILANSGTAAKPSISFASDPDTGIYLLNGNELGMVAGGGVCAEFLASRMHCSTIYTYGTVTLTLKGQVADGATAIGATIGSLNTLSTSGAKIASFVNNTTEKAYIDKDGILSCANNVFQGQGVTGGAGLRRLAATVSMTSSTADAANAVTALISSESAYVTAGAKLLSIQNNYVEKAAIGLNGHKSFKRGGCLRRRNNRN